MNTRSYSAANSHLISRIESLEKSNRRFKLGLAGSCVAMFCLGLGGLMAGNTQPGNNREVQTQRLLVTGKDGAPRAMLTGNGSGSSLFLYGPDRYVATGNAGGGLQASAALKPRMKLIVDDESSRIEMLDPDGTERLMVNLDQDGPRVIYLDKDGNEIESSQKATEAVSEEKKDDQ